MPEGYSIYLNVQAARTQEFINWQSEFNSSIALFKGFLSLEIVPSEKNLTWTFIQRFATAEEAGAWRQSKQYKDLINELSTFIAKSLIEESDVKGVNKREGVTEVFITQVFEDQELAFQTWLAKSHRAEALALGFKGLYIQSPKAQNSTNWLTFLHFDTSENLDRWLNSKERQELMKESEAFITSQESHRVISSFGKWFQTAQKDGELPSEWKQTMLVLLVLFPIVMLELRYLSPLLSSLNSAFATFIGNAISVTLIAWPMMPLAIKFLKWWLLPKKENLLKINVFGLIVVIALYLLEITIFWNLLKNPN